MKTIIDFGWDWEKFQIGEMKYRRRIEDGKMVVQVWIPDPDHYAVGHWQTVPNKEQNNEPNP